LTEEQEVLEPDGGKNRENLKGEGLKLFRRQSTERRRGEKTAKKTKISFRVKGV